MKLISKYIIFYYVSKLIKKLHIPAIKNSTIDRTSKICSGSHLIDVEMGKYSYIGNFCTVVNTRIGKFCSIANNCIIGGASHPITWVSTSPVFHNGKNIMGKNFSRHQFNPFEETIIGNDVWIGDNCLVKSGVVIGDGAVVGMGSVVTKDVEAYAIVAGNPAKLIRKRFEKNIINKLLKSCWWNFDQDKIIEIGDYMNNPQKFIEYWEEKKI